MSLRTLDRSKREVTSIPDTVQNLKGSLNERRYNILKVTNREVEINEGTFVLDLGKWVFRAADKVAPAGKLKDDLGKLEKEFDVQIEVWIPG